MNKSFRWRLTSNIFFIIVLFLALSLVISYFIFKDFYVSEIEENLTNQALLAADIIADSYQENDLDYFQQISNEIARDARVRVTVVDAAEGNVLADSGFDSSSMETHKNRPEIFKALKGETGTDIRFSNTAQIYMLYAAVPFKTDTISGVVRLAKPLNEIDNVLLRMLSLLLLTIVLTGIAAFSISAVIARRLSQPLAEITESVEDIAQGNFSRRITGQYDNNEFEGLSSAVNNMAEYLEQYLNQISEVKSQLEALLENTVNGILMVDYSGRINYVNPVAKALLFPDKEPLGRKHAEVISNYEMIEIIDRLRNNSQSIKTKITLYSLGAKIIDINALAISTVKGKQNDSILVVLNDITEITHLEQVRKDFIANVAHELKTPIASISGFAETMLSEKVDNKEEIREFSQIIYNEARRLTDLINDLFELSRIESDAEQIPKQVVDIGSVIAETVKLVKKKPGTDNYRINFAKPLEPVLVSTDYNSVVQIIINLLDNAVKYSEPEAEIDITLKEGPEEIIVSVTDKGEGIPEKDLNRIFERFYRVDQTRSRKTGGTGLGLSIVKHLTEQMGGSVGVESTPGTGSRFFFILPKH